MKTLQKGAKLPSQMAEELGYHFSEISRSLARLQKAGFVECLTPNARQGRIYALSKKGKSFLERWGTELEEFVRYKRNRIS
jgi:DNA-binding PadR family transcriptional regulator